jgi:hypothetical protein
MAWAGLSVRQLAGQDAYHVTDAFAELAEVKATADPRPSTAVSDQPGEQKLDAIR